MNQMEIFAVVFPVAAHAILAVGVPHLQMRVIAMLLCKRFRDFFVAVQATESRSARAKLVTRRTLCRSIQRTMRFRKRSRRDLRRCAASSQQTCVQKQQRKNDRSLVPCSGPFSCAPARRAWAHTFLRLFVEPVLGTHLSTRRVRQFVCGINSREIPCTESCTRVQLKAEARHCPCSN